LWSELKVLVTGGTGFIGQRLIESLSSRGADVYVLTRRASSFRRPRNAGGFTVIAGDLTDARSLSGCCKGIHTVFHLAGYAHAADQESPEAARLHRETTVQGTTALLEDAVTARVRRFVFLSSVKAIGEGGDNCLDESAVPAPSSHYGRSKLEAERLVLATGRDHGLHVCALRLPLVYGPGNKGNIPRMIAAVDRRRFPPLPEVHNRRSMVHVDDVVKALLLTAESPAANGQVYIVTDEQVYSTREIYAAICRALGRRLPTWNVPAWLLRAGGRLGDALESITGRRMPVNHATLEKLLSSAWYSSDKIRRELGFRPTHTLYKALPQMIAEHRASVRSAVASSS
jgi:UDP-glucose 4-epimerase